MSSLLTYLLISFSVIKVVVICSKGDGVFDSDLKKDQENHVSSNMDRSPIPTRATINSRLNTDQDSIIFLDSDEEGDMPVATTIKPLKPSLKHLMNPRIGIQTAKSHLENQLKLANYFTAGELERSNHTISPYLIDIAMKILKESSTRCPLIIPGLINESFINLVGDGKSEIYMWMNVISKSGIEIKDEYNRSVHNFLGEKLDRFELSYKSLDFSNRNVINNYVEEINANAFKKVKHSLLILNEKMLRRDSELIILLTLFFKAKWETPFNKIDYLDNNYNTEYLTFIDDYESMRIGTAKFETKKGSVSLYSFPYAGGQYSMVYIISNNSEWPVLTKYKSQVLNALNNAKQGNYSYVNVARIKQEFSIELSEKEEFDCFKKLGKLDVISNTDVKLDKIIHTVKFETTTEGTVGIGQVQLDLVSRFLPQKLILKPPFEYFVYDHVNRFVLFKGALLGVQP